MENLPFLPLSSSFFLGLAVYGRRDARIGKVDASNVED